MDIESELDIFFKHFNIPKVQPTLDMKELLEEFWCHSYYEEIIDDIETAGFYELIYAADQWFACNLVKYLSYGEKDEFHYKSIAQGEGDSPLYALLAMTIDADKKGLISSDDKDWIRQIFKGEEGYEYKI